MADSRPACKASSTGASRQASSRCEEHCCGFREASRPACFASSTVWLRQSEAPGLVRSTSTAHNVSRPGEKKINFLLLFYY
jgi:hypothetical protein